MFRGRHFYKTSSRDIMRTSIIEHISWGWRCLSSQLWLQCWCNCDKTVKLLNWRRRMVSCFYLIAVFLCYSTLMWLSLYQMDAVSELRPHDKLCNSLNCSRVLTEASCLKQGRAPSEWPHIAAPLKSYSKSTQVAKPWATSLRCFSHNQRLCARVVFTLFTSYQQANGPRAADGRDSPVQETESRDATTGTTCKEEKLR